MPMARSARVVSLSGLAMPCLGTRMGGQGFQHGGIPVFFMTITFGQRFHEHPMPMARFARVVSLCGLALPWHPARVAKASNMGAFRSFFRALRSGNVFTSIQCQWQGLPVWSPYAALHCLAMPWHPHRWPRLPTWGHFGLFSEHYFRATFSRASNANGKVCPCGLLTQPCIALQRPCLASRSLAKASLRERDHPPL